jgi:fibronectin type 3 domain-containing protein
VAARSRLRSAVALLVVLVVAVTVIDAGPPDDPEPIAGSEPGGQSVRPAGPPPNAATVSTWERKAGDPLILNADTPNAVPGEFLVALKGEVPWSEAEARSRRLVEKYGAELLTVLQILPGFGMRATDEQARRMAADPAVDVVEQNQRGKPRGRQRDTQITDLPWHLDRDDQRLTTLDGKYHHGFSNVPIYIVDSGVFLAHEEFENRAAFEYNATTGGNGDCIGHGTKVASAAAGRTLGVSKKSPIRSVKVWDCTAGTTEMWMADGLNWVALTASRPAVANLSMGDTGPRSLLNNAAKGLVAAGITLVIAGDNADDDSCGYSPELIGPEVAGAISVAGIEEGDLRWYDGPNDGSNYGPCLEIFAPAYDITLADNNGVSLYTDDTGNSFAAPQVAGAAALILAQHPNYSPAQVEAALIADSTKDAVTDPNGTPNRLLYVAPPDQPGTAVSNSDLNALFNAYGDQGGHWTGGDETMSVKLPGGRVAWFFGDTMLGTVNADGSRPRDTPMIHNSVVIQDGDTLTSTLHGGTAAQPKSFVSTGDDDYDGHFGWWPGEALVTGNELQVFYHHVVNSHEGGPFPFKIDEIGIATFSVSSMTYQGMTHLTGLGTSSNRQIAWGAAMTDGVGADAFTYIYGRENAKDFRHLYVARAPKGQLKNLSAWQFWTGNSTVAQQWSANERDAVSTMTGVSASFSVKYLEQYRSYVLVTFDESLAFGNRIFAYHSQSPTGPFRHGTLLYQAPEAGGGRYTYNARLHLEQDAGGATAVVSYNVNSFDWDAVYRDARLYRPRFVNVTLPPPPNGSLLPDAPRDLTAVSPADGQVKLDWTAPLQPNLRYWVYERQVSLDPVSGKDIGATQFIRKPNPVTGTTTTFGVLSQGIYEYRVAAANASGEGPPSLPARVAVRLPKPATAPANLTAAANPDGSVALSWQPVTAAGLVNYRVYQRNVTDNTSFLEASSVAVTGTTARVSGLTSGRTYEFYVVAFNGTGEGPRSNTARATSTAPPPPAPTGLTATPNGDGTITLSWNPAGAGFWYWIEMRKVGEANFTRLQYPLSTGTTHTVSYLDNRQAYEFRVVSIGTNGAESGPSSVVRATSQYAAPPVPTGLTATANSDGTIALAWKSSGSGIWYWIEMRKVGEATFSRLQYPVSTGTTHTVSLLQNGQAYEFRIVALGPGEAESAPSNVARATSTIPPPGAPTNLRATAGNGQVSLTWTAPGSGLLYWVYWRPVGQGSYNRLQNPASATSATVLPLNNGTTYEFRVTAVGSGGSESAPSNVVQARPSMPLPGAPTGLTATANADGSIRLSWNAPGTSLFYWIYMRDVTLGGAARRLDLPVNDRTTHTLTGLTLNSRYEFYVTAENQGGEGPPSNTAQATSTLPAPTGLVAWWEDSHAIYLSWNGDPNAYHYLYIRDVAAGGGFVRQNLPVHGRTWHIARPLTSTAYEFYVTRAGNGGETARTNIASVGAQYPTPSAGNLAVSMQTSPPRCVQAYQSPIWSCSSTVSTTATLSSWDRNFRVDHKLNIEWRFTGGVEGVATGICWPTQAGVPQAGCVMTIQRTVYWTLWSVGTPTNTSGPDVCIDTIAHAYYVLDAHNNTVQRRRTYWACVQPGPSG